MSNLVPGDTNGTFDVLVHDRVTGTTTRVSVASDGTEGDSFSANAALSADGRVVAFRSRALNLVPGDTNARDDIYLARLLTGPAWLLTGPGAGGGAPSARHRRQRGRHRAQPLRLRRLL